MGTKRFSANVFISNCDYAFDDESKLSMEMPLEIKNTIVGDTNDIRAITIITWGEIE